MSSNAIPLPVIGNQIKTACDSDESFSADTPRALHEGQWIFFCTPLCQQEFIEDPTKSCLTSHHTETE